MQYPHSSDALHRGSIPPGSPWRGHQVPLDSTPTSQSKPPNPAPGPGLKLPSLPSLGANSQQQSHSSVRNNQEPSLAQMVQAHPNNARNIQITPSGKPLNSRGPPKHSKVNSPDAFGHSPYASRQSGNSIARDSGAHILGSVNAQMMPKVNTSHGMSSLNTVLPGISNAANSRSVNAPGNATGNAPGAAPGNARSQSAVNQHVNGVESTSKAQNVSISDKQGPNSQTTNPKAESDKYGLRSLLDAMETMDKEKQNVVLGSDMSQSGLNLRDSKEKLSHTFASPWQETSKHPVIPDFKLPACYSIDTVVPQQQKLQNFDEGALFYIFYTMPRDAMQEAAAVELTNRSWRYHKELKMWLTKDPLSEPIQTNNQEESGIYIFFDPTSWKKIKREYILFYPDIA